VSRKSNGISRKGMGRAKRNWCPDCRAYVAQNHNHAAVEIAKLKAQLARMEAQ
jgi:hypothetical protein